MQYARAGTWYSVESNELPPTGGQAAAQPLVCLPDPWNLPGGVSEMDITYNYERSTQKDPFVKSFTVSCIPFESW